MALTRHNALCDGDALAEAHRRGYERALARLTEPEVVEAAARELFGHALMVSEYDWDDTAEDWRDEARDVLHAAAAALSAREEAPDA